jgi:hypothetical protein
MRENSIKGVKKVKNNKKKKHSKVNSEVNSRRQSVCCIVEDGDNKQPKENEYIDHITFD